MTLFIPLTKVDAAQRLVYGTISEEIPDKAGEILDYETSKPAFIEWSQNFHKVSGGKSYGNIRAMHGATAIGKLTDITFDDDNKRISGIAKIVDDAEWNKVLEGVYTGFSIGGGYVSRWPDSENPSLIRYTPTLSEVSLVDNPAVPTATFDVIKHDGSIECRKFLLQDVTEQEQCDSSCDWRIKQLIDDLQWLANDGIISEPDMLVYINGLKQYLLNSTNNLKYYSVNPNNLLDTINELQKRIIVLEKMPASSKGKLRVVNKSDDYNKAKAYTGENEEENSVHELMKMALNKPLIVAD